MSTFERARRMGVDVSGIHHYAKLNDPWTSHNAAKRSSLKSGMYLLIIDLMRRMPGQAGTSEQIAAFSKQNSLGSIDAIDVARRMSKLKERGYVRHRGDVANSNKGNPCTIWELIP